MIRLPGLHHPDNYALSRWDKSELCPGDSWLPALFSNPGFPLFALLTPLDSDAPALPVDIGPNIPIFDLHFPGPRDGIAVSADESRESLEAGGSAEGAL
ncbi:MAG TPA: hypothetical protein VN442_05640 [Bryobacteraceae bacterium]|nr:hypothetical protein [Bryobacteraceae bacterium]